MKQTAVEYLVKEFSNILGKIQTETLQDSIFLINTIERAKEMEKQQIIDAYICGRFEEDKITRDDRFYARQYYKKIFQKKFAQEKKKL